MPYPRDPRQASADALRAQQISDTIDRALDAIETERIALEQIGLDVAQWGDIEDLPSFVRGERLA
jgi:hypothetical protein